MILIPLSDSHAPEILDRDDQWDHFSAVVGDPDLRPNMLFVMGDADADAAAFASSMMRTVSDVATAAYLCRRDGTVSHVVDREGTVRTLGGTWRREEGGIRLLLGH